MSLEFTEIIALFTLIQLLFLTVVSFQYKKGNRLSNRILSGFMASNALLIAQYLLSHFYLISPNNFILIYSFGNASYLLLMPFLYLYIRSLCYKDFRLKTTHLMHLTPYFFIVLLSLVRYSLVHGNTQTEPFFSLQHRISQIEYWCHNFLLHFQIISYLIATHRVLINYRKHLKELYSSIERIDLWWCHMLLAGFTVMWFLDFLSWILHFSNTIPQSFFYWMLISSLFINLVFTLAVTYRGLIQSESVAGILAPIKYAASRLQHSEYDLIIKKLNVYMKEEKPYLAPALSIDDLAKKLKVPAKHLSQAVHICMNQNFYDLINTHRIEEAKARIRDERFRNLTLLAIAYDIGFNSKSVFNHAFKKYTGITPKEYKYQWDKLPADNTGKV